MCPRNDGCCAPLCDLAEGGANNPTCAALVDAAPGVECVPWFEGEVPDCDDPNLGVCRIP